MWVQEFNLAWKRDYKREYSRKHACSMAGKILGVQELEKLYPMRQTMFCFSQFSQFPGEQPEVTKSRP